MALRAAVATGNWSNPATWNGGVLPNPGDVVASNNFTITIDQNINVDILTNTAQSIVTAVPFMTSNTTPSGIVTGLGGTSAFVTFDGSTSQNSFTNSYVGDFFGYEFSSPKAIDMFQFVLGGATTANISFQAWNGSSWITLYTAAIAGVNAFTSPPIGNSIAYIKYRFLININTSGVMQMRETYLFEYLGTSSAVAGGGFVLSDGVSVVTTSSTDGFLQNVGSTLFTYAGSTSVNLSGKISTYLGYVASIYYLVNHTGSGTLNFIGDLILHGRNFYATFNLTGAGTLNYTGNITIPFNQSEIRSRFLNLVGALSTAYVTGNINTVTNITANSYAVFGTLNGKLYITGSLLMGLTPIISSSESSLLSIIGPISKDNVIGTIVEGSAAVNRSSATAINLFSGPFICSRYGTMPIVCVRMHLIPTTSSYFEFRDETTNGAVSPGAIAPATQLVSPATLISNLATSDVRFGIVYALGTLTGTLRMPVANQVTFGIPVDATSGNAVLTAASVWDYLVSNITTADSIGMRLKNVATPQTTGEQLEAFLRLD